MVVEYSSPNVAKEMHVGHLRTTIVGDAIARVLEFAGHRVIRDNHVGDWGTPFGMLIEHLLDVGEDSAEAALLMTDPNAFYQAARHKFDTDPEFTERARSRLVRLQAGDPDTLAIWQRLVDISREYLHQVYARLGVTLTDDDIRGESFYNDMLADTVSALEERGIATVSDGALCAFPAGFTGREGRPLPLIIRKSDGGYNYATTDLAAVRYRVDKLSADRSIYVVGSEQALHFQMVFAVAREAGWIPDERELRACPGRHGARPGRQPDQDQGRRNAQAQQSARRRRRPGPRHPRRTGRGRPLRRGGTGRGGRGGRHRRGEVCRPVYRPRERLPVRLGPDDLVPRQYRAVPAVRDRADPVDLPPGRRHRDRRRGDRRRGRPWRARRPAARTAGVAITAGPERALALRLLSFGAMVTQLGETAEPHRLCAYLFDVASLFTTFYEECPVLKAEPESLRVSRLALCALTLDVLTQGLGLLGVPIPERM